MIVLRVLGGTLLGVLALVLLLLCFPVRGEFRFATEPELVLRYLFLRFKVLPAPPKPKKVEEEPEPKERKAEKKATEGKEKTSPVETVRAVLRAEGFSGFMGILGRFLGLSGTLVWEVIRCLRVRTLDLCVTVGGEDAAAAAVLFGQASALVYGAVGAFCDLVGYKDPRVTVDLDFQAPSPTVQCEVHLAAMPLRVVCRAVKYLCGVIPLYLKFQRAGKRGLAVRNGPAKSGKEANAQ